MTRTIAFGSPPPELRKIHDVVREAQQAGIDAVRPGVTGGEVDAAARKVIEDAGYGRASRTASGTASDSRSTRALTSPAGAKT